jgi:hypothetical protein
MDIAAAQSGLPPALDRQADRLRATDRLVLLLAVVGLAGSALLGNPAEPLRAWPAGSLLEHVVRAVSLGYSLPTLRGIEVKMLVVSVVAGVLLVWAGLRILGGPLRLLPDLPDGDPTTNRRVNAASLSLVAVFLLIAWALASSLWARDAAIALGSTWVLSLGWAWAAALALHGRRRLVRPMIDAMLAVASVTAVLSLWYWHERSIEARLGWPLGNPLSLASVMVPSVLLAAGRLAEMIVRLTHADNKVRTLGAILLYAAITGLTFATLLATGSRGPLLAVLIGGAVAIWVAAPRERRVALALVGVLLLALAAPAGADWLFAAGGGRDASARMRVYAWRDAVRLAVSRPAAGHGAGAFALLSTDLSTHDTIVDPLAMSGQVSSHAHCEPLELLADLGVFGGVLGLAAWGFALAAAAGAARGPDRWLAAGIAAAATAALVDASTGVSWRLPGPAPLLAMPVALAWMLWRDAPPAHPSRRRGRPGMGLVPIGAGLAVACAGVVDFAAARFLYRGQLAMQHAERAIVLPAATLPADAPQEPRPQAIDLMTYAVRQADMAGRSQMDPPRRLVAMLAAGQMRASLAYASLAQKGPTAEAVPTRVVLDDGLWLLEQLRSIAPNYADTAWKIAELLNAKAGLPAESPATAPAVDYRQQALAEALQYLGTHPLDRDRIWRAFGIWPQIPPAQRLSLLRGALREEGEVWRPARPGAAPYVRWSQQQEALSRLWQQLGEAADGVETSYMELGYSALRVPYGQWQDPLTPEGVRLAAARRLLQDDPDQAADALDLADLLYERAGGLLPYSQAATGIDLAACRIRQGSGQSALALATLARARSLLAPLPDNAVHKQLLDLADSLQQGIEVVGGTYSGSEPEAWWVAVDLFWDMPPSTWPAPIQAWAERVDAILAGRGNPGSVTLELLIARGDAAGAQTRMEQMLAGGAAPAAIATGLRLAGYRWPARQELAAGLLRELEQAGR